MGWRAHAVVSACLVVGCAKVPPPPKPAPVTAAKGGDVAPGDALGPLVYVGAVGDRLGFGDGPPHPDGALDQAFRVRIAGPVTALAFYNSDPKGALAAPQIWDTICGDTPFPKAFGFPLTKGGQTGTLVVVDAHGKTINDACAYPTHPFAPEGEVVTLFVNDPNRELREGRIFSLRVVRPDGHADQTSVTILQPPEPAK